MLRLLKFLICLGCLAAFVWWGVTVPLGERTLYEHVQAIGKSKESQDLLRETKQKVGDVTRKIARSGEGLVGDAGAGSAERDKGPGKGEAQAKSAAPGEAPPKLSPQDHLTEADRKQMRRLLDSTRDKARR